MADSDTIDSTAAPPPPPNPAPPPRRYRCRLDSCGAIEAELRRLYRACRSGAVDVSDGSKLANMLHILARVRETGTLEARLSELEGAAANPPRLADP
jgi:hypothetical protein